MTHDALITALENIILDQVMTTPSSKPRKPDTSSPMDIGMAAKFGAGHKGGRHMGKGQHWNSVQRNLSSARAARTHIVGEKATGRTMETSKEERVTRREAR